MHNLEYGGKETNSQTWLVIIVFYYSNICSVGNFSFIIKDNQLITVKIKYLKGRMLGKTHSCNTKRYNKNTSKNSDFSKLPTIKQHAECNHNNWLAYDIKSELHDPRAQV